MITHTRKTIVQGVLLALVFILGMSGTSQGAEFWLRAETTLKSLPSTSDITMWGFAQCTDGTYTVCDPATVPGPRLTVPVGDPVLTINLRNNLTGPLVEPVSIVIPGQTAVMSPVKMTDGSGRQRVTSFTTETPPDNSTTVIYSWTNMRPGTYLYESGTHPAVQVQMGLYGAVTKDAAAGQAYGATTAYASEAILLFSEIDPVLHGHVAAGTYGTPPPTGITSTMNYEPKFFLINGAPYSSSSSPLPAGNAGTSVLLRFLNAGLKQRAPVIQGLYFSLVAEDGNAYGYAKQQYSMLLAAGKTIDAIITPASYGNYAIYDRRLGLTNGAASGGGMLAFLQVMAGAGPATELGIFRGNGNWYVDGNGSGAWDAGDSVFAFGSAGDLPIAGDWTGSGITRPGVYRSGAWYLDLNGSRAWDAGDIAFLFGAPGDVAVAGDWTGDGSTKVGVFNNGTWWLDVNNNRMWDISDVTFVFGSSGDVPVVGDWNGDGITDVGVFRGEGVWYLDTNPDRSWGAGDNVYVFGSSGDKPVVGDWNGDGTSDIGVFRGEGLWYLDANPDRAWGAGDAVYTFGSSGDIPVTGNW